MTLERTVSDSPSVRKSVREALGSSLPLSQFTLFFKHIRAIVGHFFDNEKGIPVAEEAFTVFIRETMLVMQSMFERVVDPLPLSSNVTLDSLLLSCTIYVQRLGFDSEAYQLKIQVCQLCDAVFSRRVRGDRDSTFRNALLEHFVSWASEEQPVRSFCVAPFSPLLTSPCARVMPTKLRSNCGLSLTQLV